MNVAWRKLSPECIADYPAYQDEKPLKNLGKGYSAGKHMGLKSKFLMEKNCYRHTLKSSTCNTWFK
jgi:hypothetical protein